MFIRKATEWVIVAVFLLIFPAIPNAWAALTPNASYTVTLAKANSDGTTTDLTSVSTSADSDGKVTFAFTDIPNSSSVNFLVVTIKNSLGVVVRQSLAAAPPPDSTNSAGVNGLSYVQSRALLQGFALAGSDDPIYAAFGFVLLRQPGLSDSDITKIYAGGVSAILGTGGFVSTLTSNGVTAAQLSTFRTKLISNSASGNKDLADFAAQFKTAVDNSFTSADVATQDMAKAGGFMGDIFVDAANAAGIDLSLITAAFDAAGNVADTDTNLSGVSSSVMTAMSQSMRNFFTRIAIAKVKREYSANLTAMGASPSQISRFTSGIDTMATTQETLDATYAKYFEDPTTNPMTEGIRNEMDAAFQTAFGTFEATITSSAAEITTMRAAWGTALGVNPATLPADLGTMRDESGSSKNWSIPQTVLNTQVATNVTNGGSLTYTRQTYAIPSFMQWLGARNDFVGDGVPAALASLLGIEEDLRIAEMSKFALFSTGVPTRAQELAAEELLKTRQDAIITAIGGTTDGATAYSDAQKKAIVKLLLQPTLY